MLTLFGGFRQEVTPEAVDAFVIAVADLPYEYVRAAVVKAIREDKWMPRAAELRAHAKKLMPRHKDPELLRLIEEGRQRKARPALTWKQHQETMATWTPPKLTLSPAEIQRRQQAILDQLGQTEPKS